MLYNGYYAIRWCQKLTILSLFFFLVLTILPQLLDIIITDLSFIVRNSIWDYYIYIFFFYFWVHK